ncbi:MAG: hypothetical protein A3C36_06510 [Omnitrophica WOR_2 bacterium RIFCSPHIGHO2_02_FULL_52_10]|nr:MAG: hypothetical protein A3C36_06510 [Omnitrophica WOR_2 bacterium RIFCSPHIGHO2_02_FULL_52_10]
MVYFLMGCLVRAVMFWADEYTVIKVMNCLKFILMRAFRLIGNVKVTVKGRREILKERSLFIISAHTGYLDGVILGSLVPGSFTTKEEIRNLPLLGKIVALGGSIFINRREKSKIISYVHLMAEQLRHNINIFNFPEGHATDGTKILSFFPAFFDAPLKTRSPIVPITIKYERVNGEPIKDRNEVYHYGGKTSIIRHLWNFLRFKSAEVTVVVHEKIECNGFKPDSRGRKSMSDLCIQRLSKYTNLPISRDHPLQKPSTNRIRKEVCKEH